MEVQTEAAAIHTRICRKPDPTDCSSKQLPARPKSRTFLRREGSKTGLTDGSRSEAAHPFSHQERAIETNKIAL